MPSPEEEKKELYELVRRLEESTDPVERTRLKEALARMIFGEAAIPSSDPACSGSPPDSAAPLSDLDAVSTKDDPEPDAPILRSLRGVLRGADVEDYRKYREEKYS
jgi:hypothetical protein